MGLDASPKKVAQDVAAGMFNVNKVMLKRYSPPEIGKMLSGLQTVQKELRTLVVDSGDFKALKDKGLKMQRLNSALQIIRSYIRDQKLKIS